MSVRATWLAIVLTACGGGSSSGPLASDGTHFRDPQGRAVLLRGVNARVQGVFDVTFDDGRIPLEDIPPLIPADCGRMRDLGFNILRLPVNWSGVEPEPDQYDPAYLLGVDAAVECAAGAGLFVLIDFHQDAWSKEIGEDGAPLWAIVPAPDMLLEGPLVDLAARRTSPQVLAAFSTFFDPADAAGLQGEFIAMIAHVAARYADHEAVVGFEVFNEPVTGAGELYPFTFAAAAALRDAAPGKLVFFEPPASRNLLDYQPLSETPFPVAGAVYAPHIYTFAFADPDNHLATLTIDDLRPSIDNARAEAIAWQTPLFIGEFGIGPTATNAILYIRYQLDLQDQYLASSTFWRWKEESQGLWGLFDRTPTGWIERPQMMQAVSRPYAERIAGTPDEMTWNGGLVTLRYHDAVDAPNVLYVPERFIPGAASCNGAPVETVVNGRFVEITCAGAGVNDVRLVLGAL